VNADADNGTVNWPRDPANGRWLCTPERPMPQGAAGQWAHTGTHCTYSGDYHDSYECRDCGARWSQELPE
jgi:hypothetical protein